jgi:hypothetical protein
MRLRHPSSTVMTALTAALGLAACGGDSSSAAPTPAPTPAVTPAPTARYSVTFDSTWSAESHPTDFPPDPHFSPLIGGTHSPAVQLWSVGGIASDGIEAMAERGRTTPLDQEVLAAIAAGTGQHLLQGPGISLSPGSASLEFEIGRDYPLVTLVSMIAPSPDWFVGVHDLSLLDGGDWVSQKIVTLDPFDAGTDHGPSYESPDLDARPRRPIRVIDGFPFDVQGRVAPVGTFTFRRRQ